MLVMICKEHNLLRLSLDLIRISDLQDLLPTCAPASCETRSNYQGFREDVDHLRTTQQCSYESTTTWGAAREINQCSPAALSCSTPSVALWSLVLLDLPKSSLIPSIVQDATLQGPSRPPGFLICPCRSSSARQECLRRIIIRPNQLR